VIYNDTETLLLGAKLLKNCKYETAHTNKFWKEISKKYNEGRKFYDKIDKVNCLKRNKLALWDVYQPDGTKNDIDLFLSQHPQIKRIIFIGKNVARFYQPKDKKKKIVYSDIM
jgi:hypothetical protein